jgi:hypothetical protein
MISPWVIPISVFARALCHGSENSLHQALRDRFRSGSSFFEKSSELFLCIFVLTIHSS